MNLKENVWHLLYNLTIFHKSKYSSG